MSWKIQNCEMKYMNENPTKLWNEIHAWKPNKPVKWNKCMKNPQNCGMKTLQNCEMKNQQNCEMKNPQNCEMK